MKNLLLDLVYPPKCIFCRRILAPGHEKLCPACRGRYTGMDLERMGKHFRRCVTPMRYDGAVREAILRYKFQGRDCYAAELGSILAQAVRERLAWDLITWVPVSRERRKERGYDQARLLAEAAAKALGETAEATLEKIRHNPAQSGIDDEKTRRGNVKGVYRALDPDRIAGKRILLIDDIITTGATMDEAAGTLLAAGAAEVAAAALAQPVS